MKTVTLGLRSLDDSLERVFRTVTCASASRMACWLSRRSGRAITILLAIEMLLSSCADPLGGYSPPICTNPRVLDYVAKQYSAETERPKLVPDSAVQYPAEPPDTVLCAIYVRRTVYDAARFGGLPKIVIEPRFFHVRTLADGFTVTLGR
jgi:hypothetical protein